MWGVVWGYKVGGSCGADLLRGSIRRRHHARLHLDLARRRFALLMMVSGGGEGRHRDLISMACLESREEIPISWSG